jgi:hypothetical protein
MILILLLILGFRTKSYSRILAMDIQQNIIYSSQLFDRALYA